MRIFFVFIAIILLNETTFAAETITAEKGTPAASQPFPTPAVAIVDVQKILEESLAAKSVQQQLEAQRSKFQAEISGEETGLRQAEQELVKLRNNVPPDVFAEKEQELRRRFLVVERRVQNRRKALDQAFSDSMNEVKQNLLNIVKILAKERGANLVIVKQQALWSDEKMDITNEVLAQLNKVLPHVQVKVAAEEGKKEPVPQSSNDSGSGLLKKRSR